MPLNRMKQGKEHGTLALETYKGSPIKIKEMVRQVNCFGLCDHVTKISVVMVVTSFGVKGYRFKCHHLSLPLQLCQVS